MAMYTSVMGFSLPENKQTNKKTIVKSCFQPCLKATVFMAVLKGHTWKWGERPTVTVSSWPHLTHLVSHCVTRVCWSLENDKKCQMQLPQFKLHKGVWGEGFKRSDKHCVWSCTDPSNCAFWDVVFNKELYYIIFKDSLILCYKENCSLMIRLV